MAGRYATLTAGTKWLLDRSSLVAALAVESEAYADRRIDQEFDTYDRSNWAGDTPAEITEIAELYAAGRYWQFEMVGAALGNTSENRGTWLIAEADKLVEKVKERGYLLGSDGQKVNESDATETTYGHQIGVSR